MRVTFVVRASHDRYPHGGTVPTGAREQVSGSGQKQNKAAEILNVSVATLYRMREQGIGVNYKKLNSASKNGSVVYPLHCIVKYLTTSNVKTA